MGNDNLFKLAVRHIVGETTNEENDKVNHLLQNNSAFKDTYEELKKYWDSSNKYSKDFAFDTEEAFYKVRGKLKSEPETKVVKFTPSIIWKVAVAVVIVIGASYLFYKQSIPFVFTKQVYFSDNTIKEILLPDSTLVYLNRESKLILSTNFNNQKRAVKLVGEAYFDVFENPLKPFLVECNSTRTEVLGTSFNIKENDSITTIDVFSGKVNFSAHNKNIILTKGNKGEYLADERRLNKMNQNNINANAWQTKQLIFDDTELSDVLEIISTTYNIELSVGENLNVSDIRFTGRFNQRNYSEVLDILALTLYLEFEQKEEGKFLVKRAVD
jgi:ferric-dicitrate binding protein FerR (iron transport regulator)